MRRVRDALTVVLETLVIIYLTTVLYLHFWGDGK
jgi:hypothetical protein